MTTVSATTSQRRREDQARNGEFFPNGDLQITFHYFEHSGDGDFFSVDSYTADGGVGFEAIPYYTSTTGFGGTLGSQARAVYVQPAELR